MLYKGQVSLGGSEVAAAVGLSRWQTPLQLWRILRGLDPPPAENPAMREGKAMELPILREYVQQTGAKVVHVQSAWTPPPPAPGWVRCSLDAVQEDPLMVLEVKWTAHQGQWEEIPREYFLQGQWYLHWWGRANNCNVVRFLQRTPGALPYIHDMPYNPEVGAWLEEEAKAFMELVTQGIPPDPQTIEERKQVALSLLPPAEEVWTDPPQSLVELGNKIIELTEKIKELEDQKGALEAEFLEALAQAKKSKVKTGMWTASVVERQGAVRWAEVAKALNPPPDLVEKYRGTGSRFLQVRPAKAKGL